MTGHGPLVAAHRGTYRAEMKNGHAVALKPFEGDPDPSEIGEAMLETLNDDCRIGRPMLRKGFLKGGRRDRRGRDSFAAVSWDKALDLVARQLKKPVGSTETKRFSQAPTAGPAPNDSITRKANCGVS